MQLRTATAWVNLIPKGSNHARPILVRLIRIADFHSILSNRGSLSSPIYIKPDMTKEERHRESVLLKERWNLIQSGVPKNVIRIQGSRPCNIVRASKPSSISPPGMDVSSHSIDWLRVCLFNSRSLVNKLSNFQSFVYTSNFNILCITETWLTDSVFDLEILPTDFTIYRKDRHSRGGGVLIAVDDLLQ